MLCLGKSFYLPGLAPNQYQKQDPVELKALLGSEFFFCVFCFGMISMFSFWFLVWFGLISHEVDSGTKIFLVKLWA